MIGVDPSAPGSRAAPLPPALDTNVGGAQSTASGKTVTAAGLASINYVLEIRTEHRRPFGAGGGGRKGQRLVRKVKKAAAQLWAMFLPVMVRRSGPVAVNGNAAAAGPPLGASSRQGGRWVGEPGGPSNSSAAEWATAQTTSSGDGSLLAATGGHQRRPTIVATYTFR